MAVRKVMRAEVDIYVTDPHIHATIEFGFTLEPQFLAREIQSFATKICQKIHTSLFDIIANDFLFTGVLDYGVNIEFPTDSTIPVHVEEMVIGLSSEMANEIQRTLDIIKGEIILDLTKSLVFSEEFQSLTLASPKQSKRKNIS